ncbi:MAG: FAD-dependent oxidoreductase [Hadesarchaea archaeon]|nr:MAG: FAD-dependent oxidoreductase [Hadesarchaea archaeon]
MKVGILGGGLAGLASASFLKHDFEILEKNNEYGGLCRSFTERGFTFDYGGGHIIFSKDKKILEIMIRKLGKNVVKRKRNTKIFFKGRYVKYPFENGLSDLSRRDNAECLYTYVENWLKSRRRKVREPRNFREWMYRTFGKGITEKYLIPYNRKVWNFDPGQMSVDWVRDRVPQPPVEDVIKSSLGVQTEGYTHQLYFYYPKVGGIYSFIRSFARGLRNKITLGFDVKHVRKEGNKWIVSDGKIEKMFDRIISTIPIENLVDAYRGAPKDVKQAADGLKHNSLITVLLGFDIRKMNDIHWLYFPREEEGLFNKVCFPFNNSPEVVPRGKSSAIVEITCSPEGKVWKMKEEKLIEHVVDKLHDLKVIKKKTVCFSKVAKSDHAYVINDLDYERNTKILRRFFSDEGVVLCGRFSEFKYLGMDATVKSAMEKSEQVNRIHPSV